MRKIKVALLLIITCTSCNYGLPLIKFKDREKSDNATAYVQPQQHQRYNYIRISKYGIIGYAHKSIYWNSDSTRIDSVFSYKGTLVFDGCTTTREKLVIYDAFGNHKVVVKTRIRTHGFKKSTHKRITKMYVPIRRMRTVERY